MTDILKLHQATLSNNIDIIVPEDLIHIYSIFYTIDFSFRLNYTLNKKAVNNIE